MYKYYRKNDKNVMEYDFDSITEFLDYIETAPISRGYRDSRLASETGDYEFTRTRSLAEAKELIKYGYHEEFEKLVGLKYSLEKYIKMSRMRGKQFNDYVGYAPDVKAYLEGNPLSMLNRQNPQRKHIDIYFNASFLCYVSAPEIFNRGAITLCLIEILENMGFSVDLNIFTMAYCDDQIHYAKFNLKNNSERTNIQKLYFPLCHPSFLRRLVFRLKEVSPDIESSWTSGYGRTCDDYMIRSTIDLKENDIVICQPEEMGVKGKSITDDANAMFDYINRFNPKDIELQHVEREQKLSKRRA